MMASLPRFDEWLGLLEGAKSVLGQAHHACWFRWLSTFLGGVCWGTWEQGIFRSKGASDTICNDKDEEAR